MDYAIFVEILTQPEATQHHALRQLARTQPQGYYYALAESVRMEKELPRKALQTACLVALEQFQGWALEDSLYLLNDLMDETLLLRLVPYLKAQRVFRSKILLSVVAQHEAPELLRQRARTLLCIAELQVPVLLALVSWGDQNHLTALMAHAHNSNATYTLRIFAALSAHSDQKAVQAFLWQSLTGEYAEFIKGLAAGAFTQATDYLEPLTHLLQTTEQTDWVQWNLRRAIAALSSTSPF